MAKAASFGNKKLDNFMNKYDPEKYGPDEIDRRIIRILSKDGRASYTQIAGEMNLTPATIRYRVNRLIEMGVIKNFKPLVDKKLYNLDISAYFMISLEATKFTGEVVKKLQGFKAIRQISILANNPNIICTIFAQNMDQFSVLLSEVTQIEGIKDVNTNFIIKTVSPGCFMQ